jgi:hypothetical protein
MFTEVPGGTVSHPAIKAVTELSIFAASVVENALLQKEGILASFSSLR